MKAINTESLSLSLHFSRKGCSDKCKTKQRNKRLDSAKEIIN